MPGTLVSAGTISGKVLDPEGKPVVQVRLLLVSKGKTVQSLFTDAEGGYVFSDLPSGTYELLLLLSSISVQKEIVVVEQSAMATRDLRLRFSADAEEIVVTATRTQAPAGLIGNSVSVLTDDEIEAQHATSVAELLRNIPGSNVLQIGGRGSLTSLFVRGGESDYNKVLLDGIPLNQPGGAVDLSNLSTMNVSRVEVVRGPQSALYGSDAITSVIQIFTIDKPAAKPEAGFFLEGGSYDTFRAGTSLRASSGPFSFSSSFQHLSTENSEPNDYFRNNSVASTLQAKTSRNSTLTLLARAERGKSGVPGPTAFERSDEEEYYRKRDLVWAASWEFQNKPNWSQRFSYSHSFISQLSEDPVLTLPSPYLPEYRGRKAVFPSFDFPFSFLSATRRQLVSYQSDLLFANHGITIGIDAERQRGHVGEVRAERSNWGIYLQDQFLLSERASLAAGIRLEDNGSFGFAATPRLSFSLTARDPSGETVWGQTRAKFNFGLGIKEPNFVESFSQNPFFKGNPELEAERTRSFEAGVEQLLFNSTVRAELNFFHNIFDNLVAFETTNYETFEGSFFNIGESRAWGFEQIVQASLEPFRFSAGYTYLNSRVLSSTNPFDPVFAEGERLLLRPTHSGYFGITWHVGRWTLDANVTWIGNRADSDFRGLGLREVAGYAKGDASAAYQLNSHAEAYLVLENIANSKYFEEIGFPALGFHFRSGMRFRF